MEIITFLPSLSLTISPHQVYPWHTKLVNFLLVWLRKELKRVALFHPKKGPRTECTPKISKPNGNYYSYFCQSLHCRCAPPTAATATRDKPHFGSGQSGAEKSNDEDRSWALGGGSEEVSKWVVLIALHRLASEYNWPTMAQLAAAAQRLLGQWCIGRLELASSWLPTTICNPCLPRRRLCVWRRPATSSHKWACVQAAWDAWRSKAQSLWRARDCGAADGGDVRTDRVSKDKELTEWVSKDRVRTDRHWCFFKTSRWARTHSTKMTLGIVWG